MTRSMLLALLLTLLPSVALAMGQVRRYAIVVGNNLGEPGEVRLKYAESDARRVADVLRKLGNVPNAHISRLYGATSSQLLDTLEAVERRIKRDKQANPEHETLLLVYYSGHAGERAVHMGGTTLSFPKLKARLDASSADMRVIMIDACHSGELTRVKGAKPTKPFALEVVERSASKGTAIITSSTAGEDAQESDRLRGSFFTHHLLAGLLGAADQTRDGRVTLSEAYEYAYTETLRATSRLRNIQHPTYAFQIRGRKDVVLTFLESRKKRSGRLKLRGKGQFMLFEASARGRLVTEISVERAAEIVVEPGAYFVRHRYENAVYEGTTEVKAGQTTGLSRARMTRVPYAKVVRKGTAHVGPQQTLSVQAAGLLSGELLPQTSGLSGVVAGVQLDTAWLAYQLRLSFGQSSQENEFLRIDQTALGLTLGALHIWDVGAFGVGVGGRAGVDFLSQDFVARTSTPSRRGLHWRLGPMAQVSWTPFSWIGAIVEGGVDLSVLPQQRGDISTDFTWTARGVPYALLGLEVPLP